MLVLDNCDTVYTAAATLSEIFDPADLMTEEEEQAERDRLRRSARIGMLAAGAVTAGVAAAIAIRKLFGRGKGGQV